MVSGTSQRPDITESIPLPLSAQGERAAQYAGDRRFDININGLGFLLRPSEQHPYQRGQDAVEKDQFDNTREAGEQTLGGAWRRSQTSWHLGAGAEWYDPGLDPETQYRFATSHGVDVWDEGALSLLPDTSEAITGLTGDVWLSTARRGGVDGFVVAAGTAVSWRDGAAASVSAVTLPSSGATQPAVVGELAYVGHANNVTRFDFSGAGAQTVVRTCTGTPRCWWVKSRLFAALGNKVYWVDATTTGTALGSGADLLVAEHPDVEWVWTDVAESPDAILLAGHASATSAVYAVTVTEEAGVPEFTAPRQVAALPPGEWVTCMGTYLSSYVILGTSKGVRVGLAGQDGQVQYGPLTVLTDQAVVDVTFSDRWAYLPVTANLADGSTGVVRVDLSAPVADTGLYAWAWDVTTHGTAVATSICFVGTLGRPVVAAGAKVHLTGTALMAEGWLESGMIRFATTEKKDFQRLSTTGVVNAGEVEVRALVGSTDQKVIAYDTASGMGLESEIRVGSTSLFDRMAFRLVLRRLAGAGPVVESFTVKARPAVTKTRLFRYPLGGFDFETNRHGHQLGYEGFGWDRLHELEALDDWGEPVVVQDRRTGEAFTATIETVEFTSTQPPDRGESNSGGIIDLIVRRR